MVYVDELFTAFAKEAQAARVGNRNGNQWCHMWTDGPISELHSVAVRIGLKTAWFQDKGSLPHYDLTPSRRVKALQAGAEFMPARLRALISLYC